MKQIRDLLELDCFRDNLKAMNATHAVIDGVVYWLQDEKGRVIAAANIHADTGLGGMVLWNMCVASDMRGKGIGEKLLKYILTQWPQHPSFRRCSDGDLYLYVEVKNRPAISLYLKFGFEIVDERVQQDTKVYVMRLSLT